MRQIVRNFLGILAFAAGSFTQQGLLFAQVQSGPSVGKSDGQEVTGGGVSACPVNSEFHPDRDGIYEIGGSVKAPKLTYHVEPEFTDEARQESNRVPNFRAKVLLSVIIDKKGRPQKMCVAVSAKYGFDNQAMKAVKEYRFDPATKDGSPVAVRMMILVNFIRVY